MTLTLSKYCPYTRTSGVGVRIRMKGGESCYFVFSSQCKCRSTYQCLDTGILPFMNQLMAGTSLKYHWAAFKADQSWADPQFPGLFQPPGQSTIYQASFVAGTLNDQFSEKTKASATTAKWQGEKLKARRIAGIEAATAVKLSLRAPGIHWENTHRDLRLLRVPVTHSPTKMKHGLLSRCSSEPENSHSDIRLLSFCSQFALILLWHLGKFSFNV